MASDQKMTQATTQAPTEATKAAIMVVRVAEGPAKMISLVQAVPGARMPALRQPK